MMWLWIAAAVMSAGMAVLVVQRAAHAARRARRAENPALAVYRRQMAELDELADRGLLADGERRSVRAETGRRLLAAADRAETPMTPARPLLVLAAAAATPLAAGLIYLGLGAPSFPDQPFARRLAAWKASDPATLTAPQMAAVLRALAAQRPGDPEPLKNLAMAQIESGQPLEAIQALHRSIMLAPRRSDLWALLGVASSADGDGGADAFADFQHAVDLDPAAPQPRLYLGRARIAGGDLAGGLADLRAADAALKPGDPDKASLAQAIAQVAATGKLPTEEAPQTPAPTVGGPQIQAMVDGLAARLKANPDDAAGWVRLVRAYSVLGENDRRDAALGEARKRYGARQDVLTALGQAAAPR